MQLINFTTTVSIPQTSQLKFKISCWHSNFHRNNFIQASLYSSGVYEPPIITKRLIKILSCPYGSSFIKPLSSSCNFNVKKRRDSMKCDTRLLEWVKRCVEWGWLSSTLREKIRELRE